MRQSIGTLDIEPDGQGLHEITAEVAAWQRSQGISDGLLTLFVRHTSASVVIQENADATVLLDLQDFFSRVAPEASREYRHTVEGDDDMPAHIRAALTQTSLSIPIVDGEMVFGTWQGIFLFEHRRRPRTRAISLHVLGT